MTSRSLLAAVPLVTSCASADQYVYTKPGATEQKERDKTDCLFDARVTTPGSGWTADSR